MPPKVRNEFRLTASDGERELVVLVAARMLARPHGRALAIIDYRPAAPTRRRTLWWALAALPIAGIAWLAWQAAPEARRSGSVEVAIPGDIEVDLPEIAPQDARPVAPPVPIKVVVNVPPPSFGARHDNRSTKPAAALLSIDRLPAVEAATRASFASGTARSWSAKGLQGYAVAGPIQVEEGRVCRNIAIWAKGAGGRGSTVSVRKCMAAGGAWISVGGPVPADPAG